MNYSIGCPAAIIIAYVGEFHSDKYRAKAISWVGSFVAFSSFYLPTVAWIILPMQWSFIIPGIDVLMRPWRLLIVMFSLPGLIVLFFFFYLPESPKFLWSVGESEKSLIILRRMFTMNTGKDESLYSVRCFLRLGILFQLSRNIVKQLLPTYLKISQDLYHKQISQDGCCEPEPALLYFIFLFSFL